MNGVAIFAAVLFAIQSFEGTALYFSVGCVAFVLIAALAFNIAGGLTRASGAYVFCYSVLVVLIGICYKAFLGEPAQSNLLAPRATIEAYVGSIAAMFGAVIVSSRLSRKSGLLQNLLKESEMYRASVGCLVFGVAGGSILALLGQNSVRLQSAFGQLNQLIPLGIIIGVMHEIRSTGGARSTNLPITLSAAYFFFLGMADFSKQGMLTPLYCWFLPVCALRFRLSAWQMLSCLLTVFVFFYYLAPLSQVGRSRAEENSTLSQRIAIVVSLEENIGETQQLAKGDQDSPYEGLGRYYNKPQGFWDRLQFVSVDDRLINFTDQGHVLGLEPIYASFLNLIPHAFWPEKPTLNPGNSYAHEMGVLSTEDTTTGISFSPTAEAYHLAKWIGVLVIAPLLWCMFFIIFDSLFGDLRDSPWGLLTLALITHAAPEGGITHLIYLLGFGVEILIFCAFFATWFAPILAIAVLGPDRRRTPRQVSFGPTPPFPG